MINWIRIVFLNTETKEGRKNGRRESCIRGQQTCPLYNINYMYITHEYFTHTESDAEINKNIALTLVMIIVRTSLK